MCSFMRLEYVDCSISQNFGDCSWSIGDSNKSARQGRVRGADGILIEHSFGRLLQDR